MNLQTNQIIDEGPSVTQPRITAAQGQYLAFIYAYTCVLGRPPAEADLQQHFNVTAPTVHQMVLTLERNGWIKREPGIARSMQLVIPPEALPVLRQH
jgi:DNA-binding MarR family transcriptional regulator